MKLNRWQVWREHRGLFQEQLAEKIDISKTWITRLEQGQFLPDVIKYMKLSHALGIGASLNVIYPELWELLREKPDANFQPSL